MYKGSLISRPETGPGNEASVREGKILCEH